MKESLASALGLVVSVAWVGACGSVSSTETPDATAIDAPISTEDATADAALPIRGALRLDGDDDIVVIPPSALLDASDFTVEYWIFVDRAHQGTVVTRRNGTGTIDYLWELSVLGATDIGYNIIFEEGSQTSGSIPGLTTGAWHHVVSQFNNTGNIFYIDGVGRGVSSNGTPRGDAAFGMHIGQTIGSARGFDGVIDELRIWNRRLSIEEIEGRSNIEIDPAAAIGLIGYWRFNEPLGSQQVLDSSGNELHGTLGADDSNSPDDPERVISDSPVGAN